MKIINLTVIALLIVNMLSAQLSYKGDIANVMIDFDPTYMKKYEYQTAEGYIVEESYLNYHIPLNLERTLILKVQKSTSPTTISNYTKLKRHQLTMTDYPFIERVNHNGTHIYLNIDNKVYKVAYTMMRTMSDEKMSYYAPPHLSFTYDYKNDYFPGGNIMKEGDDYDGYIARHYYHGTTEVEGIQNDVLLKMYNDACYNREYGVTTPLSPKGQPNPYLAVKSKTTNQPLYRSCQHPVQSEYLKGIGLYKEFYTEGTKVYSSNLVAIDDIPVQEYLELVSGKQKEYNFANVSSYDEGLAMKGAEEKTSDANISENIPGKKVALPILSPKGNTIKSPVQSYTKAQGQKAANPFKAEEKADNMTFGAAKTAKKEILVIGPTNRKVIEKLHKVQTGETLFRLSQQYNIPVETIKNVNNLKDNTIYTDQELIIRAN